MNMDGYRFTMPACRYRGLQRMGTGGDGRAMMLSFGMTAGPGATRQCQSQHRRATLRASLTNETRCSRSYLTADAWEAAR